MSATKSHLDIYIYKILAQLGEGKDQSNGMSGDGLKSMNNLVDAFDSRVISNINRLMVKSGKKTVSANEIRFAIRLTVRGSLATEAIDAGEAAVTQYRATIESRSKAKTGKGGAKLQPMSRSKMADINFPVTRIENIMMERITSERKSGTAAVFFAAASEYVATRILTLSAAEAEKSKKVRITTRHLKVAYSEDPELAALFKNVIMSGGVVPSDAAAVPAAAPKKARSKKAKAAKPKKEAAKPTKAAKAKPAKAPAKGGKPAKAPAKAPAKGGKTKAPAKGGKKGKGK